MSEVVRGLRSASSRPSTGSVQLSRNADMNVTAEFRFPRVNLREKPVVCHAGAGREPIRANFKPTSAFAFRI